MVKGLFWDWGFWDWGFIIFKIAQWFTLVTDQHRWLSGLRRSLVHSLIIARHCVLRNWDRIPVMTVRGLISRAGMVSIDMSVTVTKRR